MDALAVLTILAIGAIGVVVIKTLKRQREQVKQTALDLFLPVLDANITEWMEMVAEDKLDITSSRAKAKELGIDPRMMYVIDLAEEVLHDHGHEVELDEIYQRAQGLYDGLRSNVRSPIYKPSKLVEADSAE